MWRQPSIWEPQGTKFRPYSITALIFFISESFSVVCFAVTADCGSRIY
jgi:hypothetical protein